MVRKGMGWLRTARVSPETASRRRMAAKALVMENVNEKLVKMEYAVRGPLVVRAVELEKELKAGAVKPFKSVIKVRSFPCLLSCPTAI